MSIQSHLFIPNVLYIKISYGGAWVIRKSHRKAPDKGNEPIANSKVCSINRQSNRVHRRAVFATTCITLVIILGSIIVNSASSRTLAYAHSMKGIGVGIYWEHACTNRTLSLNWGHIKAGSNSTLTVYIKNEGRSAVSLWLRPSSVTPSIALDYMTLTWTYSGRILSVDEVIPVELILNVSPTITGITNFSFDTIITTAG